MLEAGGAKRPNFMPIAIREVGAPAHTRTRSHARAHARGCCVGCVSSSIPMTRVSIAMATYNGERFIREQLDSFAAQSRLPDQLVMCDDGPTDRTVAIAEEFAASAPFAVTVRRNPGRLGYSDNFSRAISLQRRRYPVPVRPGRCLVS